MVFSEVVGTMSILRPQCDDDSVDRLHYYYTTTFLLVVAVLISLKMFGGNPIECWLPAEFRPSWQEYTELICWSMSTYFAKALLPTNKQQQPNLANQQRQPVQLDRANGGSSGGRQTVAYYQWTPFFLIFSAIMFYSPCLIWRRLSARSGLVLNEIVGFAMAVDHCPTVNNLNTRAAKLRGISAHLSSVFRHRSRWHKKPAKSSNWWQFLSDELRYLEAYLAILYLTIKLLFLSIVLMQAYLLNRFLQTDDYDFYGWGVLRDLVQGRAWSDSGNFPRITFCDVDVRILGSTQRHTVQCILVINIFTEKVFVMLWAWYSLLMLVTLVNTLSWLHAIVSYAARKEFVMHRLRLANIDFETNEVEEAQLDKFVREFLRIDGLFVLQMLNVHTGEWVCADIVDAIWEDFKEKLATKNGFEKVQKCNEVIQTAENCPLAAEGGHQQPPDSNIESTLNWRARRRSKKVALLEPLVARPSSAEEELLLSWTSMPNLWMVQQKQQTQGCPSGIAAHFIPSVYPLQQRQILSQNLLINKEGQRAVKRPFRLTPSASLDEQRHPLVGQHQFVKRAATTGMLSPSPLTRVGFTAVPANLDEQEGEK